MGSIDSTQLSEWYDAHSAALVLYARQWVEARLAEDVVQDVFARLMGLRTSPDNPRAWLFASVRNAALSMIRSQARRRQREKQMAQDAGAWFDAGLDDLIDAKTMQEALVELPDEQREPIVLRIWAGLTVQEIAEVISQPASTVFLHYRQGLAAIRQRMVRSCRTTHP